MIKNNRILFGLILSFILFSVQSSFGKYINNHRNKYIVKSVILNHHKDKAKIEIDEAAYEMFKQASKNFKKKEYLKSAVDLMLIFDSYPEFSNIDEVIYMLANSMYKMKMFSVAEKIYRLLLKLEKKTKLIPKAILGLQKVQYYMENYQESLKFYTTLESQYPEFKGILESRYYAIQSHYHLKNYSLVLMINEMISRNSEFYPYGMYTVGLSNLKKKNVKKSIENFTLITKLPSRQYKANQIIDSARLTLSYIYFELSNYKTALRYLLNISHDFSDYPDVLLTIAWNTLKLKEYNLALKALNNLIENYPKYYNLTEAQFLRGQCYLRLGYYNLAINEYDEIIHSFPDSIESVKLIDQTNQELKSQEKRLAELNAEILENKVEDLNSQLFALELKISTKSGNGSVSDRKAYIKKRRKEKEQLIRKIIKENKDFENKLESIAKLKNQIEKRRSQKKWQAYASYGKVRALYLKQLAAQ